MSLTVAPSDEACQALVDWINDGTDYTLPSEAAYTYQTIEDLADVSETQVVVTYVSGAQLNDTLAVECGSRHELIVWVRSKLQSTDVAEVADMNLLFQQVYHRVNAYRFPANRVIVRECGYDDVENPDRDMIKGQLLYKAGLIVRVEVKAP